MLPCALQALDPVWSLTPDTASGVAGAITRYADDNQVLPRHLALCRRATTCTSGRGLHPDADCTFDQCQWLGTHVYILRTPHILLLQIDLLVVGRRGQGLGATIRNWTGLGSVSSHLMGNAHCPVIVTHPDEEPQQ